MLLFNICFINAVACCASSVDNSMLIAIYYSFATSAALGIPIVTHPEFYLKVKNRWLFLLILHLAR